MDYGRRDSGTALAFLYDCELETSGQPLAETRSECPQGVGVTAALEKVE